MPEKMSPKTLKEWQARLAYCHRIWEKNGMVVSRVGSREALGAGGEPIWKNIRSYRLDPWDGEWGGIRKKNLAVSTLGFSAYNTWSAGLLARNPKCQVLPRLRTGSKRATDVAKDAMLVEALLNYDIARLRMKREFNRALQTSFNSPLGGIVRHGFTPSEEFFEDDKGEVRMEAREVSVPDRPWVESVKSWNIRIDPTAPYFDPDGHVKYVFFRQIRTLDQIRKNPNLKNRRDLKSNINLQNAPYMAQEFRLQAHPDAGNLFESWVCYEATERIWFEIADGLERPLREPDAWPIPWPSLPYDILQFNEQEDNAFQFPYATAIAPTLKELNKLRTIMGELVKRLRRVVFVAKGSLAEGEWDKLSGEEQDLAEFVATEMGADPQTVAHQMQLGGLDTTLIAYAAQLLVDVREALGQSQMDRSQRANVETAAEANAIQQGSAITSGRNQEAIESFLGNVIRKYAAGRQAVTEAEELVPLFGVEDTRILQDQEGADFLRVSPEQVKGEYDFDIVAGSTLQRSRQQELALAMANLNVANATPEAKNFFRLDQFFTDYLNAAGLSLASHAMTTPQRKAVAGMGPTMEQAGMGAPSGGGGGGAGLDDTMRVVSEMMAQRQQGGPAGGVQ